MTVPAATTLSSLVLNAQVVGNAFVEQYYNALLKSPELVYKFYNDTSILSRPNSDGVMTSVSTLKDIDAKIRSLNFEFSVLEIETVDAQDSHKSGIIVAVTGSITLTDGVRRKFAQTFFLAPQKKGYFLLNDVFRCFKETGQLESYLKPDDCDSDSSPTASLASAPVVPSHTGESVALTVEGETCYLLDKEEESDMLKETIIDQSNDTCKDGKMAANSSDFSGTFKKNRSYASVVKVPKDAASGAGNLRWTPTKTSPRTLGSPNLSPEPTALRPTSDIGPQSSNPQEVEGHSIYIRNLPSYATVTHVTEEFSKFGPIRDGGVQIKIHKEYGYRYGFVEFQSLDSMQKAVKESPLTIGGLRVAVKEKASTIRVSGNSEPLISERGNVQNSSSRGRGSFGGHTAYRYQRVSRS